MTAKLIATLLRLVLVVCGGILILLGGLMIGQEGQSDGQLIALFGFFPSLLSLLPIEAMVNSALEKSKRGQLH